MVNLPNKDRTIFDLSYKVVDIINEYQKTGKVDIRLNSEGICLRSAGFYEILDYVCKSFNFDKKKIIIETPNSEEFHNEYTIIHNGNHWIDRCKFQFEKNIQKTKDLKSISCFIGKPNWHRLIIAAWMYNKPNVILTCHYAPLDSRHQIDSELTEINFNACHELPNVVEFLSHCPVVVKDGFLNYTIEEPTHYDILDYYPQIFLDLVIETYVTGLTFFPTEKTLRPIIAMTPFIIMGPQGYVQNLKRIGFKTFSDWWDEDYDNFNGYERWVKIKNVLDLILDWNNKKLNETLNEMQQILQHNRNLLRSIDGNSTKLPDSLTK